MEKQIVASTETVRTTGVKKEKLTNIRIIETGKTNTDTPKMITVTMIIIAMMMVMIDMVMGKRNMKAISTETDINTPRKTKQGIGKMRIITNVKRMIKTGIVTETGITMEIGRSLIGGETTERSIGRPSTGQIMIDKGTSPQFIH